MFPLNFKLDKIRWDHLANMAEGLNYAEIVRSVEDAIKDTIIHDREIITGDDVQKILEERKTVRNGRFALS